MDSRLDQTFLIDVSEEDDSLLPLGVKAMLRNRSDQNGSSSGDTVGAVKDADVTQKDDLLLQQAPSGAPEEPENLALPVMTEEPVLVKKKKGGFNVRKSLAWNNAFLTEEGVLDTEELSLVNSTFQKPLGLPKPSTFKKSTQASKTVKPPMMPKIVTSHNPDLTAGSRENMKDSTAISSLLSNLTRSLPTLCELHVNDPKGLNKIKQSVITPIAPAQLQIESSNKEKALFEAQADASESKVLLRRSLDQKIQNSLISGVHPCNGEDNLSATGRDSDMQASMASDFVVNAATPHLKKIAKSDNSRGSKNGNEEAMRQSSSLNKLTGNCVSSITIAHARPVSDFSKSNSETASSEAKHAIKKPTSLDPGTFAGRVKPSGLRMPSPKLGFFDTKRTTSEVMVPREKAGHGCGVAGLGRNSKDVEIGSSSRHASSHVQGLKHPVKPSYELTEATRRQTVEFRRSSNISSAPHVHAHGAEIAAARIAPGHKLPRSASYPSNGAANPKLHRGDQILQARKNGNAWGKPQIESATSSTQRNPRGQENFSPGCENRNGVLRKCKKMADGLAQRNLNMKANSYGKACDDAEAVQKSVEIVQAAVEPSHENS